MDAISFLSSIPCNTHLRQAEKQVATSDSICIPSWDSAYDLAPALNPCTLFEHEDVIEDVIHAKQAEEVVLDNFPEVLAEEFDFPVYSPAHGPCFGYEDLDLDTFRLSPEAIAILRGDDDFKPVAEAVPMVSVAELELRETVAGAVPMVPVAEFGSEETVAETVPTVPVTELEAVAEALSAFSCVSECVEIIDLTLGDSSSEEEEDEKVPRKRARVWHDDVIVISDDSETDN